jgi:GT2 family glycosyltransferase
MKVTAVTVTYGNRYEYLNKVLKTLIDLKVNTICIVLNGVEEEVLKEIHKFKKLHSFIYIVDLKKNTGSANGFAEGIKFAKKNGNDFIWLLDDDNQPQKNALESLKNNWKSINDLDKESKIALLSYREDREVYKRAIQSNNPQLMLGEPNSFLGLNLNKLLKRKKNISYDKSIISGKVIVAPYGGAFFHTSLIDTIGFPNKDFFLYGDDYDFFYRISQKGGYIKLLLDSKVDDLETSFHLKKVKGLFNTRFFLTESKTRLYYNIRNNIIFEQNFVTNKLSYRFSRSLYFLLTFLLLVLKPKHFWKYLLLFRAVNDAKCFLKKHNAR